MEAFEREAARVFMTTRAVATGSGRGALSLILRALGLSEGDEVLLPALTFSAVPGTIEAMGLVPVLVDVDPATAQMDPGALGERIGPRSKVVLATHLMGLPCPVDEMDAICLEHGLTLVEDFAQAAGARIRGRSVGSRGTAGFTSLETVKTLAAFGGGLITTSDEDLADRVLEMARDLPAPGVGKLASKVALGHVEAALSRPLVFGTIGWPLIAAAGAETVVRRYKKGKGATGNHGARLHPAQASAARVSLRHLEEHVGRRRDNARVLSELLPRHAWRAATGDGDEPAWYQMVVRTRDRTGCTRAARRAGVDVDPGVLDDLSNGSCREAAALAREALGIPCQPGLTRRDLERVAEVVGPWLV